MCRSNSSYFAYTRLYGGLLFQDVPLEKIVVVFDEQQYYNASAIYHTLTGISQADVQFRRTAMKRLARYVFFFCLSSTSIGRRPNFLFESALRGCARSFV